MRNSETSNIFRYIFMNFSSLFTCTCTVPGSFGCRNSHDHTRKLPAYSEEDRSAKVQRIASITSRAPCYPNYGASASGCLDQSYGCCAF